MYQIYIFRINTNKINFGLRMHIATRADFVLVGKIWQIRSLVVSFKVQSCISRQESRESVYG
jgi:hypothetical protein